MVGESGVDDSFCGDDRAVGCYIFFSPSQASAEKAQTQMHFDVSQCQQTGPNL